MLWREKSKLQLKASITFKYKKLSYVEKSGNSNNTWHANEAILLLLSISSIKGKTKLQKEVFLTKEEFLKNDAPGFGYYPYQYGPYSTLVDDVIKLLQMKNKIRVEKRRGEGTIFSITQKGKQDLAKIAKKKNTSSKKLQGIRNKSENKLEDQKIDWDDWSSTGILQYTYRKFPRYTIKSVVPELKW